jgi:hypothetical protein
MLTLDRVELLTPAVPEVFDAYAALEQMAAGRGVCDVGHASWLGGWLVAVLDVDASGIAALVAGAIAGAAVLAVDSQRERVKELLRLGICDFVVNDLDEALRILKNEVRKKQPVSVCLSADPARTALEMVERGLQPEVLAGRHVAGATTLVERGALWLQSGVSAGTLVTWRLQNKAAAWAAGPVLARVDELASATLEDWSEQTPLRRHWLQRAPRYLGRKLAAERCVRMSDAESTRLLEAIGRDRALAAQLVVTRNGVTVDF